MRLGNTALFPIVVLSLWLSGAIIVFVDKSAERAAEQMKKVQCSVLIGEADWIQLLLQALKYEEEKSGREKRKDEHLGANEEVRDEARAIFRIFIVRESDHMLSTAEETEQKQLQLGTTKTVLLSDLSSLIQQSRVNLDVECKEEPTRRRSLLTEISRSVSSSDIALIVFASSNNDHQFDLPGQMIG